MLLIQIRLATLCFKMNMSSNDFETDHVPQHESCEHLEIAIGEQLPTLYDVEERPSVKEFIQLCKSILRMKPKLYELIRNSTVKDMRAFARNIAIRISSMDKIRASRIGKVFYWCSLSAVQDEVAAVSGLILRASVVELSIFNKTS